MFIDHGFFHLESEREIYIYIKREREREREKARKKEQRCFSYYCLFKTFNKILLIALVNF